MKPSLGLPAELRRCPSPRRAAARWQSAMSVDLALIAAAGPASGSEQVRGETATFRSPNGVPERCVMLARMPVAQYRDADVLEERAFCGIDLHGRTRAVCPNLFSTSPGTLVCDVSAGPCGGNPAGFERDACPRGPLHEHVRTTFGLTGAEFAQVVSNTRGAAEILRESCRAGRLRFDPDPEAFPRDGKVAEARMDCDNP